MKSFEYLIPSSMAEALNAVREDGTVAKAAGVDLLDLMKEGLLTPSKMVHLRSLKELDGLTKSGGLRLGPNVTLAELAAHEYLTGSYRALRLAADAAATPQIRNMATLGGNLCQRPRCWYFRSADFPCTRKGGSECFAYNGENQYHAIFGNQDGCAIVHPSATAVALSALDATLKIRSVEKERELGVMDFFVAPAEDVRRENVLANGELITEVHLPILAEQRVSYYYKQKEKQSFDWPIAEAAVAFNFEGGVCSDSRIILGAAAPIPWRTKAAEDFLNGKTLSPAVAREAAEKAMLDATPLSENSYKVTVFKAVISRALLLAAGLDPINQK